MSVSESESARASGSVQVHRAQAPNRLGFGVVTASNTRTPETDTSGDRIRAQIEAEGHQVLGSRLVKDHPVEIRTAVEDLLALSAVDVVVVTGGTGPSPWDVTVEAVTPLFERPIPGFGELFRMLSWEQVGAPAMLSRATAGIARGRAIFLLPGSPKAVGLAMEKLILPEAGHLVALVRKR